MTQPSLLPNLDQCGADFSQNRRYRFRLWRRWAPGAYACFLMLNPSTANETELDPTLRRCVGFARQWSYGALVVVNLFAIVSADPRVLLTDPNPVGDGNDQAIRTAAIEAGIVVCGWGAFPEARDRAANVMRDLGWSNVALHCLGTTKDGHPKHPLYLRSDTKPQPYVGAPLTPPRSREEGSCT